MAITGSHKISISPDLTSFKKVAGEINEYMTIALKKLNAKSEKTGEEAGKRYAKGVKDAIDKQKPIIKKQGDKISEWLNADRKENESLWSYRGRKAGGLFYEGLQKVGSSGFGRLAGYAIGYELLSSVGESFKQLGDMVLMPFKASFALIQSSAVATFNFIKQSGI